MPEESHSEYMSRMTDDGTGQVADDATIQANIQASFDALGNVVSDVGSLPDSASLRSAGRFTDAHDAEIYLEMGGLVFRDETGETLPPSWVYFFRYFDETLEDYVYEVWLDDDTE